MFTKESGIISETVSTCTASVSCKLQYSENSSNSILALAVKCYRCIKAELKSKSPSQVLDKTHIIRTELAPWDQLQCIAI